MLHITNGDSAATSLRDAGLPGAVVPWRDALNEGPVPAGLALDDLRPIRARFIADMSWGSYDETLGGFAERDAALAGFAAHDEVVLWFEHDLYDQLQLLQALDWLAGRDLDATRLSLICIDAYPGVAPFYGLGQLTPGQLAALFPARRAVTPAQLARASAAWAAFTSPDPTPIETLLAGDTSALPFLRAALLRHLEQFPAVGCGLSRTERQILETLAAGDTAPRALFRASYDQEEAPFMGDTGFFARAATLGQGPHPLLANADGSPFAAPTTYPPDDAFVSQRLTLTDQGRAVLAGHADWIALRGGLGRWLGGVHLYGPDAAWRWNPATRRLVPHH